MLVGMHIRQSPHACVTSIKCPMTLVLTNRGWEGWEGWGWGGTDPHRLALAPSPPQKKKP